MPLAIIALVCPEARVKFKNVDFQTEADFACYCITSIKSKELTVACHVIYSYSYSNYSPSHCQCQFEQLPVSSKGETKLFCSLARAIDSRVIVWCSDVLGNIYRTTIIIY